MENIVENCLKAINKANNLKNLNMFITLTSEIAMKQAEQSHAKLLKSKALLAGIKKH